MRKKMNNRKHLLWIIGGAVALFIGMGQRDARADSINDIISVDTSGLPATPGSEIVFFLIDGSGIGDSLNTAMLSSFTFGGGSAGLVDSVNSTGGVSGDMASGVTMTETSFTNVFAQVFTAGSALSFDLNLTTNLQTGLTPDQFGFAILDPSGNPISTSDPTGDDSLAIVNINSSNPPIVTYSDIVTVTPVVGTVATPEPSAAPVIGVFLLLLFGLRWIYWSVLRTGLAR